jgi:hypothetical protein
MVRRIVVLLAVLITVAALGAVPAHAGGPTSVLLSAPPKLLAVGYDDPRYEELQRVTTGTPSGETGFDIHAIGDGVTATWLIHDMEAWRIDVIYPEAPGGPWIARRADTTGRGELPEEPVWYRPTNPSALLRFLASVRLHGPERSGEQIGGPTKLTPPPSVSSTPARQPATTPTSEAATAPEARPTETTAASTPTFFTGWRWMIPGFLLGAVVAVLAVRLLPKRRWELTDVE